MILSSYAASVLCKSTFNQKCLKVSEENPGRMIVPSLVRARVAISDFVYSNSSFLIHLILLSSLFSFFSFLSFSQEFYLPFLYLSFCVSTVPFVANPSV